MLKHARSWFSQLTLIQALCLWAISDDIAASPDSTNTARERRTRTSHRNGSPNTAVQARGRPARTDLASVEACADHWRSLCGSNAMHPFLLALRELVVSALTTRKPDCFLWIDESGVIGRVGSRPVEARVRRKHSRWIPPSAGWTALDPAAQQLVADVLLVLNLAERGNDPQRRDARLVRANRTDLPPCVRGKRDPLDPHRTVGMVGSSAPGSNCAPGCKFELCPYPPKGQASYRAELSEAFCRRQQALLAGHRLGRRTAPWQGALPHELKGFWEAMEERARR